MRGTQASSRESGVLIDMMFHKDTTLLVIAPHPDDEIFGCGGLIRRVKEVGGKVFILFLTVGTTKDFSKKGESTLEERLKEINRVAKLMRYDGFRLAFPGNDYHLQLDQLPIRRVIDEVERGEGISIEATKPMILAIPSAFDYNQDHRVANQAAITATRPVSPLFKYHVPTVLEYEFPYFTWTSEPERPAPNLFVELDEQTLGAKLQALRLYKSQLKSKDAPLSLYGAETLARMRGIHAGTKAAEAFILRRSIV